MATLEDQINSLPPDMRRQVEDFVESLTRRKDPKAAKPPRFEWAGALGELKDQYTSVELQHQIVRWRSGGE